MVFKSTKGSRHMEMSTFIALYLVLWVLMLKCGNIVVGESIHSSNW